MNSYLFQLGRKPLLSIAELLSIFPESAIKDFDQNFATLEFAEPPESFQVLLDRLGGTRKIVRVLGEFSTERIIEVIKEVHSRSGKKVIFSASTVKLAHQDEQKIKKILQKIKLVLKEQNIKSRYKEQYLGGEGTDFTVWKKGEKIMLGLTEAIQNIRSYSERDYEKPFRDAKSGMLPPKLAQIMINLAGVRDKYIERTAKSTQSVLYDPFCGSGSVLMEGILMNYEIVGSDLDAETIQGARKNIEWMHSQAGLFQKDIKELTPADLSQKPDLIVTESYLGPFFKENPNAEKIKNVQEQLESLYRETFKNLAAFNVPIVIALPCHKLGSSYMYLPHVHEYLRENGFKIRTILPEWIVNRLKLAPIEAGYIPERKTFLYDRPEQKVAREIFVLEPR